MNINQLKEMRDLIEMCMRRANETKDKLELITYTVADQRQMGDLFSTVTDISKKCVDFQTTLSHLSRKLEIRR